jgi:hypothetical protein
VKLIKHIHFNPEVPENHNIRKYDKEMLKVYEEGDWTIKNLTSALMDLVKRYRDEMGVKMINPDFENYLGCKVALQLLHDTQDITTDAYVTSRLLLKILRGGFSKRNGHIE